MIDTDVLKVSEDLESYIVYHSYVDCPTLYAIVYEIRESDLYLSTASRFNYSSIM